MKGKTISLKSMLIANLSVFLMHTIIGYFAKIETKTWFVFLVLATVSAFNILFYYKKNKSFMPLEASEGISVMLSAIGATVVIIGSILFMVIAISK